MLLNQAIALVKGEKTRAENEFTKQLRLLTKTEPMSGISRTYRPKDDDGDIYPDESTSVQFRVEDVLSAVAQGLTRLFDLTAVLETGNTVAVADVVVDGHVLLSKVPVTYLLFLEKKLTDLNTFVASIPTLDPAQTWTIDEVTGNFRSASTQTVKTKKIPRNHVKAEATDKHPAQVEMYTEDVVVGYWTTTKFSGASTSTRANQLLDKVRKLQDAVKTAREQANSIEVRDVRYGATIFDYLFS
jgi:hypothetical protein